MMLLFLLSVLTLTRASFDIAVYSSLEDCENESELTVECAAFVTGYDWDEVTDPMDDEKVLGTKCWYTESTETSVTFTNYTLPIQFPPYDELPPCSDVSQDKYTFEFGKCYPQSSLTGKYDNICSIWEDDTSYVKFGFQPRHCSMHIAEYDDSKDCTGNVWPTEIDFNNYACQQLFAIRMVDTQEPDNVNLASFGFRYEASHTKWTGTYGYADPMCRWAREDEDEPTCCNYSPGSGCQNFNGTDNCHYNDLCPDTCDKEGWGCDDEGNCVEDPDDMCNDGCGQITELPLNVCVQDPRITEENGSLLVTIVGDNCWYPEHDKVVQKEGTPLVHRKIEGAKRFVKHVRSMHKPRKGKLRKWLKN